MSSKVEGQVDTVKSFACGRNAAGNAGCDAGFAILLGCWVLFDQADLFWACKNQLSEITCQFNSPYESIN